MNRSELMWVGVAAFAVILGVGSALPLFVLPSMFAAAGPRAGEIVGLAAIVFGVGAVVFILVEVLLVVAIVRFRQRSADELPVQTPGNLRLELAWTAIPFVVLIGIFFLTIRTMNAVASPLTVQAADALTIDVVGHQWWWEYRYPALGIVTANEVHIPVGRPVRLRISSVDVIHSFWVPQLAGKLDAIPGRTNELWIEASRAGSFYGACGEYCGVQHAWMRILVFAHPQDEYDEWVRAQSAVPPAPTTGPAAQGYQSFTTNTCISCHTVRGTVANGAVGPDLTHFGSRTWIAGGVARNTPDGLKRWLRSPQNVKPGNLMPNTPIDDQQIDALVAYLEGLK